MALETVLIKEEVSYETQMGQDNFFTTELQTQEQELVHVSEVGIGLQGNPGPPGPAGGAAFQRVAGVTLSAHRLVYELDGKVYPLSAWDGEHIDLLLGVTVTAAQEGGVINIQRIGAIDDDAWSWTPGRLYLGENGAITETPPEEGFCLLIGAAVSATRITLNIQDAIELE